MASVIESILTAIKTAVETAAPGITTVIRKQGVIWQNDTKPKIIIQCDEEGDDEVIFGNSILRDYRVLIILVYAGNKDVEPPFGNLPTVKQTIKRALDKPTLTGVSEVWNTSFPAREALFDESAFPKNFDKHAIEIIYSTSEVRNA